MNSPVYVTLHELMALEPSARGLSFAARQRAGSVLAGSHGSRLRGRGLDFLELRRYVAGDDLKQLDARASLRLGKPFVRVFAEERDRPVLLLVDQRMDMFFGSVRYFKSVLAARLAALTAWAALRAGDRVGGLVLGHSGLTSFAPLRSRARVQAMLAKVAAENASLSAAQQGSAATLDQALKALRAQAPHDCLICIISDFGGMTAQTERELRLLRAHNDIIGMLVFDPLAQKLPRGGHVRVSQGELQIELAMGREHVYRPLADYFSERLLDVTALMHRARAPLLSINTADDALPQLRLALGLAAGAKEAA